MTASNLLKVKLTTLIAFLIVSQTILPIVNAETPNFGIKRILEVSKMKFLFRKIVDFSNEKKHYLEYKPGEIIVKFKSNINISLKTVENSTITGLGLVDKLNRKFGIRSIVKILANIYKFVLPRRANILSVLSEYNSNPYIEYAEPNYIYHTCIIPNDVYFNRQWALHNTGQNNGTPDADIDAVEAWDIETGKSDIVIAILDTGVDYLHPDLINNIWVNKDEIPDNGIDDDNNGYVDDVIGWDFVDNDNDPADEYGHGTLCAGVIGAVTNNSLGIAGVCWGCKIMPVRVGRNRSITIDAAIKGIKYAADNGARVISMSWGGYGDSRALREALDYAYSKGVVLVAAAGNNGLNLDTFPISLYPAEYENVISVAATDRNDEIANFSNYGVVVDVAAPGVDILSTAPTYTVALRDLEKNYSVASGTSMACPYVSGLVGLILSRNPDLNPSNIRTILQSSVDAITTKRRIAFGRINAFKSLQKTANVVADIMLPSTNIEVEGIISIRGTAIGDKFEWYILEYGEGFSPDVWIQINKSNKPVENGLIGVWDTTKVDEGIYTLRLTVVNDGIPYEDRISVKVNNLHNTIFVDDDNDKGPWEGTAEHPYRNIQDAIDIAGSGDTVYVFSGRYREDILIHTPITLMGEDKQTTIIHAKKSTCITIFAKGVKVSGFKLIGKGCSLWIYSSNNIIERNIIMPVLPLLGRGIGIIIQPFVDFVRLPSRNNKTVTIIPDVKGNIISYNEIIKYGTGIFLVDTSENIISHNNFKENLIHATFVFHITSVRKPFSQKGFRYKPKSFKNSWDNNYWDDWIGIRYNKYKIFEKFPKIIQGLLVIEKDILGNNGYYRYLRQIKWLNFDRSPLSKPWGDL